jgi:hypothetical protein
MYKNIIRISLAAAVLLVIFTMSANTFAVETAHRTGYGYYSPAPIRAPYYNHEIHRGGYDSYHSPSRYHDRYYHGRYIVPHSVIVAPPVGIYLKTPRVAIGVCF